jgi:hypothetical protein
MKSSEIRDLSKPYELYLNGIEPRSSNFPTPHALRETYSA